MAEEVILLSAVQEKLRLLKTPFDYINMTSAFDDSPRGEGMESKLAHQRVWTGNGFWRNQSWKQRTESNYLL